MPKLGAKKNPLKRYEKGAKAHKKKWGSKIPKRNKQEGDTREEG